MINRPLSPDIIGGSAIYSIIHKNTYVVGLALLSLLMLGVFGAGATSWSKLSLGGGGNESGLDITAQGTRFVRSDCCSAYVWGTDNAYHNLITTNSMPLSEFGLYPRTNTNLNQSLKSFGGVMEVRGCPSSAACAYLYANGYVYYSANVSTSTPDLITWCNTGGFTQTADTSNGVVGAGDPAQFVAIDPANPAHVYVGTPTTGVFETFNGDACASSGTSTWTAVSTSSVPLSVRASGSYPGYAIAFDPTSVTTTRGGHTVTTKAYIYSSDSANSGTNAGVYATTDGGATWAKTASGPATVQHLKVSSATAGAGHVWATDSSLNLWERIGTTWTHLTSVDGHASDVTINPLNGDHVAVGQGGTIYTSTNGSGSTPTFISYAVSFSGGGDAPWQPWINLSKVAGPNGLEFDPLSSDTLVATGGQGVWTTSFPTANGAWVAQTKGIESLINWNIAVSAANAPSISGQDEGGSQYTTGTASTPRSTVFPVGQDLNLSFSTGLAMVPGQNMMLAKTSLDFAGGFDASGSSTDGFNTNYLPLNQWNVTVASTALAGNGSGTCDGNVGYDCNRVTVPSTTGLKTFAPGDVLTNHSIMCVISNYEYWVGAIGGEGRCYPITVIDHTHVDLQGYTRWSSSQSAPGYTYTLWVPAEALDNWVFGNTGAVVAVASDSGLVQLTIDHTWSLSSLPGPICISGVTMTGATKVNGCWVTGNITNSAPGTVDLRGSSFVGGDSYVTGGVAKSWMAPGGTIAGASPTNITVVGADKSFPLCTTNSGGNWTKLRVKGDAPYTGYKVSGTVPAGATTLTLTSSGSGSLSTIVTLVSGRKFELDGTISGTTFSFSPAIPPGDSIVSGAALYSTSDTGWPWAVYLNNHTIVADTVTANTFYGYNYDVGMLKWANCDQPSVIAAGAVNAQTWSDWTTFNATLKAVPGEAGHLFFGPGPQGSGSGSIHPAGTRLSRTCGASGSTATMQLVPGMYEPQAFGFGAPASGYAYPTIYVVGWYSSTDDINNAQYGIWESVDDANHGATGTCTQTNTWTNIATSATNAPGGFPLGWGSLPMDVSGDPFTHGPVYYSGNFGAFYGVFP